jgi:tetratricopeptide (TPR) repeat protein/2-polyprenyl-3-methyl-5-hydroxy-6-metoxy-1,4-benzoquinol methylase
MSVAHCIKAGCDGPPRYVRLKRTYNTYNFPFRNRTFRLIAMLFRLAVCIIGLTMNRIGRNDPCHCGSGKKYKQCCMQREEGTSFGQSAQPVPRTVQISRALQTALEHHQNGRFADAEAIYRQVLKVDPVNFDALHMLGVLAHQVGQYAQAIDIINQAIRLDASDPLAHNNLGNAYRALGRHDEALASFKKALSIKPDFYQIENNVGETYRTMGRFEQALASFQNVLSIDPRYAEAHNNMGLVMQAQGKLAEAENCFKKALSFKPGYAKAQNNLGNVFRAMGNTAEAQACYDKALSLNPDLPEALAAMGSLLKDQGNLKKALLCIQKALQLQPAEADYWSLYAEIIKSLSVEALNLIHGPTLLQAFKKENIDPQKLEHIAVALLCNEALARPLLEIACNPANGAHHIVSELLNGKLKAFVENPLLIAVLEETVVTHYRLEKLLISIRRALLAFTIRGNNLTADKPMQRFITALALQCFANEYIYVVTAEELQWQADLQAQITASINTGESYSAYVLMLLATYQPLYRLDFADRIQTLNWQDADIQAVVQRQLIEPATEQKIKPTIPGLTGIANVISQAVRKQYEENPYPQWRRRGAVGQGQPVHIALQQRFPHQPFPDQSPASPEILIAGCGTGSDAVQVVQSFKNARILAIDMSLTSLAYAKRATQTFGIDNIEFQQADILELGSLDRQFDIIVSSGVLHHMRDPLAGWRNLASLLRPNGYMNIGLYSRRARHEVTRVRQLIHEKGYASTTEGIRQFRAEVMSDATPIGIGTLALTPDFYSTSACRDLVFHVEEHLFSPLEIQSHLQQLDLQFLGFEFSNPHAKKLYLARFPENPACDSLENWELIEAEKPEIFAGMYQFWLKKI